MGEEKERMIFGSPNMVNLCMDFCDGKEQRGRLYHPYQAGAFSFSSLFEAFAKMERLYDELGLPKPSTGYRSFRRKQNAFLDRETEVKRARGLPGDRKKEIKKVKGVSKILEERGECATFVVRVMYRQRTSWQGEVIWVEEQKKERFRSALELVRLLDSVLDTEENHAERGFCKNHGGNESHTV